MKRAASGVLGFRVAYGAALLVAPDKITKSWLGPLDDASRVALRGARRARDRRCTRWRSSRCSSDAPVQPLLAASIAGDLNDIVATALGRGGLPGGAAPKTAAVAGGSAALTALSSRVRERLGPAARARHRPPHVGPGARRLPGARRDRGGHAGLRRSRRRCRRRRPVDAARARGARCGSSSAATESARRGQLARRLGRAGDGAGGLGAVGHRDRARRAVAAAAGPEAFRGAARRAGARAGAAARAAERAGAPRRRCSGRSRTRSACRTRPRCGWCGRTRTRRGSRPRTAGCARGGSPGWPTSRCPLTLAWPEHDRLVSRPADVPRDRPRVRPARVRAHAHLGRPGSGRSRCSPRGRRARPLSAASSNSRFACEFLDPRRRAC